ncbi:MAG: hypothetical protein KF893_03130 [Caldilineaceae bacterium]|nr:hypothetical protein [Caldilineaceae bacterium]
MPKQLTISLRLASLLAVLFVGGWRFQQQSGASAFTVESSAPIAVDRQSVMSWSSGATVTQTFTLAGGWNTIYLEVEPINPSPLVNEGTEAQPIWVHERSGIEAIFAQLDSCACLEGVWTWNVPTTRMDYIVDPAEGLWDEPGWRRYIPDGRPDAFLTDLVSLRANTGYLVQLKEGSSATLSVVGRPVVRKHRWVQESYNLAGFPILAGNEPTRQIFFGSSPISQVYQLNTAGEWVELAATEKLASGHAYLVYYGGPNAEDAANFTAPLVVQEIVDQGLNFGAGSHQQGFTLQNLSAINAPVSIALLQGNNAGVALRLTHPITQDLRSGNGSLTLSGQSIQPVKFSVLGSEQPQGGEALLQISAPDLGVRWLLPVVAQAGAKAGLWVGEVTVTEVSEGRLGSTNVESSQLTIGLYPQSEASIRGAAEMRQIGNNLQLLITLALPGAISTDPLDAARVRGDLPYVGGYLFWDANQNGLRDGDEAGLAGLTVTLGTLSTTTAADGSYRFTGLTPGDYTINVTPPPNYTADFEVTRPVTPTVIAPNLLPASLSLSAAGITAVSPAGYVRQVLLVTDTLPYYDQDENSIQPLINFGFVPSHSAELVQTGPGGCADVLANPAPVTLGAVKNGLLPGVAVLADLATLLTGSSAIRIRSEGGDVACGEIQEAAPTLDPFRFRILLRVKDEEAKPELLPYYELSAGGRRISSVAFSLPAPKTTTAGSFSAGGLQQFEVLAVEENDPLNPFKHKYHPDHDNLDALFRLLPGNLQPYQYESVGFKRRIQLTLLDDLRRMPGMASLSDAEIENLILALDWGGIAWGGTYKEVISGVHKHDITVQGTFVIRQVLRSEELREQPYD